MTWERDENEEELLARLIEALPRLKQYHLSEPQKVFVEMLEKMKRRVEEEEMSQIQLAKN
jgi:predicted KAP-like P-loop ATPase